MSTWRRGSDETDDGEGSKKPRERLKAALRSLAARFGYEIVSHSHMRNHELRRDKLLADLGVDLVIDGGANRGQYAGRLRAGGFRGRILSVEPIEEAFAVLADLARKDGNWECILAALGETSGRTKIRIAPLEQVSSLLEATGAADTEGWRGVREQETTIVPLAEVLERESPRAKGIHLKLDLQGYEMKALLGAGKRLPNCLSLEIELTTVALYSGAETAASILHFLSERGFEIFSLQPSAVDFHSGRVLELESLFVRGDAMGNAPSRPATA